VLASDVQVGAPGEVEEDEARFALTSEAGLNDGLAFPFVNLAIALAGLSFGTAA
jgi:NhaP-type Na+/H+ or K+/H+ antiporter